MLKTIKSLSVRLVCRYTVTWKSMEGVGRLLPVYTKITFMENVPVAIIGPVMKALDRITQVSAKLFCIYFATQVLTDCDNAGDFTVGTIRNSN